MKSILISCFLLVASLLVFAGACSDDTMMVNPDNDSKIENSEYSDDALGKKGGKDNDNDGVPNRNDNCPDIFNPGQEDADGDGIGDACETIPPDPGPPNSMHVESVLTATVGPPDKRGLARVTIVNENGIPVEGATVTGNFSGDFDHVGIVAITNDSGFADLQTPSTKKGKVNFDFCVAGVQRVFRTYDFDNNAKETTCAEQISPPPILASAAGYFAYISSPGSSVTLGPGLVSVIDLGENTVDPDVIHLNSDGAEFLAISPDEMFAFTMGPGDNISIIDLPGHGVITVPVGTSPRGIAITPDGAFAYVAVKPSNVVSVIDLNSNNVIATIPVPATDNPENLAITPDGAFVYVVHRSSESYVSVIDADPANTLGTYNTVTATIRLPDPGSRNIEIHPDGLFAYVSIQESDKISVIDLATNAVITTISTALPGVNGGPEGITFAPDGSFAYVAIEGGGLGGRDRISTGHVLRIETGSHSIVGPPIPTGAGSRSVAFLPDASYAYVTNCAYNNITVIDVGAGMAVGTIATPVCPIGIKIVQRVSL